MVTNDLEAIELLYGIGSKFPKVRFMLVEAKLAMNNSILQTDFYRLFGFPDVYGVHQFSALPNGLHKKLVRFTAGAFSMTSIVELEPFVDSSVDFFVSRIKELGSNRAPLDMAAWFQWYAFDVIGELTFSTRYGFMEMAEDVGGSTKILDMFQAYVSFVGQAFSYHWLLLGNPLFSLFFTPPSGVIGEVCQSAPRNTCTLTGSRRWLFGRSKPDKVGQLIDGICYPASSSNTKRTPKNLRWTTSIETEP